MIDKVKLHYDLPTLCQVTDPKMFQRPLRAWGRNWHKYNADKQIKKQAYYPFVVHRSFPSWKITRLEVDVSLPKVVFGNNLYELDTSDWTTVCNALSGKLQTMGIQMSPQDVGMGAVQQIEYGKNIPTGRIPVCYILQELSQAQPINNYLDIQKVSYRNGESLYFYCESYDIIFYNKGLEVLEKAKTNLYTLSGPLKAFLNSSKENILRMEVRFHNRKVLMDFLHTHGFPNNHGLLQDVYSKHISQTVLKYYWHELSRTARLNSPFLFSPAFELWKIHQGAGAKLAPQQTLARLGARYLLREHGYKGAIKALELIECSNPPQILKKLLSRAFKPFWKLDIYRFIDIALSRFTCLGPLQWNKLKIRAIAPWYYKKEPLLKLTEVAQWLNVSVRVLRKEIKALRLVAHKIGGSYRVARYDILGYINA